MSLPEGYKEKTIWLIIPSPCMFSLHYTTLPYYSTVFIKNLCVNNSEANINKYTDVFTVRTTIKDQSGGIYNSYSTSGDLWLLVNKPCPRAVLSGSVRLLS